MRVCVTAVCILLLASAPAAAQGQWFDIGDGTSTTIYAQSDPKSSIYYPPYPFGPFYPPGTLVYCELFELAPGQFAAVYLAYFDDGGCGCTGLPSEPVAYQLHYDEADLDWPEGSTTLYIKEGLSWVEDPWATLDVLANVVTTVHQLVPSNLFLAIGGPSIVPVESATWGRIKDRYRDP